MFFDVPFLDAIRARELDAALRWFPQAPARVLEIGAGTGAMSKRLGELGYEVDALDVEGSIYEPHRVFPVQLYDGKNLPFPDATFDAVFSSAVLMQIPELVSFLRETKRVTKPGGRGVHAVSSASWRFWTNLTHYPSAARAVARKLSGASEAPEETSAAPQQEPEKPPLGERISRLLVPSRLGERGSAFTELYTLSRRAWVRDFEAAGFRVTSVGDSGIFYAGHMLLGQRLPLEKREALAGVLGSSGLIIAAEPA